MAMATCLVGLDVHARQTHAAVLHLESGELAVSRLRMAPDEVASFLEVTGSRPTGVTRSAWLGCWPLASFPSRSCRAWRMRRSVIWSAA